MSPDTDFLLLIIPGYRPFPTVLQSHANYRHFQRSEFAVPHGHRRLVLLQPVVYPFAVFGEIALAPVTVCRCSRPQYRAGFVLVAQAPVAVADTVIIKITQPLFGFTKVVCSAARCVTSTKFRYKYRQSL